MNRIFLIAAVLLATGTSRAADSAGPAGNLGLDLESFWDPIVITAPRNKISKDLVIDPRINDTLLRLLQQRAETKPGDPGAESPVAPVFASLTTLTGHKIRLRYTELGLLLTEGLAGAADFRLQNALEEAARSGKNPQIRAAAMVSLAHTKDERFLPLFQQGLRDENITARLGALESLIFLGGTAAELSIADAARDDAAPVVRVMAAAAYWKSGNPHGREILIGLAEDPDWFVRANAIYYLGEHGGGDEYRKLMDYLYREQNPIVKTELARALVRLEKYK